MSSPDEVSVALEKLLRQELSLYREVRELSRGQKNLIEQNDSAALMQAVSEKQFRINKIAQLEQQAAPFKARRETELESWPDSARKRVDPLVRELQTLLGEIVALEDESRAAAEEKVTGSRDKVQKIQTGKAMLNAYGKAMKGMVAPRYKDKNA